MKIVADAQIPHVQTYFGACGELVLKSGRTICHHDVKEAEILLVRSITHVNEALLANTQVKFVGSVTAGADHLDTKWLDSQGIVWKVATGFNAPPVADYVVSVIAALQKKKLLTQPFPKAAVIGVGHVGRLVAKCLQLLNFDVLLCDPVRAHKENDFFSTPIDALEQMDLVTLHVPLTKNGHYPTFHFIDKKFFQRQKAGCVLINASRGSVINFLDLLAYGQHLHWCFDVWEHEPNIQKNILAHSLLATPHIAGYSIQSKIRGIEKIYRLACKLKMITPLSMTPILMPEQRLNFTEIKQSWQDVVLDIFNPCAVTTMMRTIILPEENAGCLFDEMRTQFNYRYEFNYTVLVNPTLLERDKIVLAGLGMKVQV